MDFNPNDYTAVGKLLKPFAVKGEIKVMPLTFDLDRLSLLNKIFIQSPRKASDIKELTIESARTKQDLWFVKFEEITSPEDAKRFNGWIILIHNDERLPLEEGEFYLSDLEGFQVESSGGTDLGTVKEVIEYPTANTFHIKYQGQDIMAPWIDECIVDIDDTRQVVIVNTHFLSETYEFLKSIE
ncbi:MAG: ribosome maturation factor RimM [Fibrobacterales bacterium]